MKQRISALDLQILAAELKTSLEGYRLNNIYNASDSNRQFLLRFNKPDSKLNVIVDCGLRIHLTEFTRPIPSAPSGFVMKLRKHLKSKRLTALRQVKNDRILVLQFADGLFFLVLEFFSAGNVILLDENRKIMSLQRIVHEHENIIGETYTMFDESLFHTADDTNATNITNKDFSEGLVKNWLDEVKQKYAVAASTILETSKNDKSHQKKKIKVMSIHKLLLSKEPHLSSDLLSKNLKMSKIDPSTSALDFENRVDDIIKLLNTTESEYHQLLNDNEHRVGYILDHENKNFNPKIDSNPDLEFIYETFHPFEPYVEEKDKASSHISEIPGYYNKTLDKFFSTIESSKYALRIQNQELQAKKKLDEAKLDNQKKLQALIDVQSSNEEKGHLIVANADLVEEAKSAIQGLVDQQMDWNTIEKLIKSEQKKHVKIAELIVLPLNLKENKFKMKLPLKTFDDDEQNDTSDEDDNSSSSFSESDSENASSSSDASDSDISDFETEESVQKEVPPKKRKTKRSSATSQPNEKMITVTIDLGFSAYANASEYFNAKKTSAEKQKRVEKNIEKAMKNIEEKVNTQLKKKLKESHEVLKKIRTPYFFEKYHWFISSEGYLVMMGKNDAETDQIYSKYIEDDDVFMSNNFGTKVWIKNPMKHEVPPNTLMQAGILCMSSSEAWSKKIASSAWWCNAKNVTKFDKFDKSVLPPGVFVLKDEKDQNTLPASQLVMGLGFLWKVKTSDNGDEDVKEFEGEQEELSLIDEEEENEEFRGNDSVVIPTDDDHTDSYDNNDSINIVAEIGNDLKDLDLNKDEVRIPEEEEEEFDNRTIATGLVENMNKNVRGKKGKLKKMQKKYADQDESERLLRLQALGTLRGLEKQQLREKEEIAKQQKREYKKAKREKQKEMQALKFTRNEKVKVNYQKPFTELKAVLTKDDKVVDIVPVFAPWPALLKYKYKVKIQPGSAKKTKTLSEILHFFMNRKVDTTLADKEIDWPNEHELIKTLKEQDLVLLLCVDKLKVTLPGKNDTSKKGNQKNGSKGKSKRK
ncbi:Rqc2p NDAI_0G03400 [Naumovozyma dairenensis CBS 421]|uniref:Ribosome quality control complex subunit 2 n=1 Tax=Naumovozyma dairenensis (strain ATCC 10597 / BCRC 20456 / CBS 421 / NBRC 0211 / NRRL Y-12639) TaxID=1071378 RepID=G0WEA6_NAUDC|nr:hypothetical protein NDAI_0G03400 [Naumovozyma dairenensis CBS 421]CCD26117.2 hypothetical protein NDAI_0G03400 [Naumovozyma dairenensis CBS 421]